MLKCAFILILPGADSRTDIVTIEKPNVCQMMVGVKDFDDAVNTAKSLVEDGVELIEVCGGFGPISAAKVIEAVGDKVPVGSVSFGVESAGKFSALLEKHGFSALLDLEKH